MRDAFAVLVFVSVGMLLTPSALFDNPPLLAGTLAVVMVATPLVAFCIMWMMRYPLPTGLSVAVALAQIGEFSFMLSRGTCAICRRCAPPAPKPWCRPRVRSRSR